MSMVEMLIAGFGVLSLGVWLLAVLVNAVVFLQRVVVKKPSPLEPVGVVALIAGVWTFFAVRTVWPNLSLGWLALALTPQVFAMLANAMDYRKPGPDTAPDSDNPKA